VAVPCPRRLRILHRGAVIAATGGAIRTLETSHPPTYYFPPGDIAPNVLQRSGRSSYCEWKGVAVYFDVRVDGATLPDVAWSYPDPTAGFSSLRNFVAFYAWPFDDCFVDDERVTPQPGNFYGGWITSDVAGPFKGGPGSRFW
jgi:uncharacterized protein (DUF427 family)